MKLLCKIGIHMYTPTVKAEQTDEGASGKVVYKCDRCGKSTEVKVVKVPRCCT